MKNDDFVMLRSLNKENYIEGNKVLWKRRKNKWELSEIKINNALSSCYRLINLGYAFKVKEHKCIYSNRYHYYGNMFKITPLGKRFLERNNFTKKHKIINKKESSFSFYSFIKKIIKFS